MQEEHVNEEYNNIIENNLDKKCFGMLHFGIAKWWRVSKTYGESKHGWTTSRLFWTMDSLSTTNKKWIGDEIRYFSID